MRSAIASPMPRVEPVMTATFPFMSNKVMFLSQIDLRIQCRYAAMRSIELWCAVAHLRSGPSDHPGMTTHSGELFDFRSRKLVHLGVRIIRNPRLLIDHRQPPDLALGTRKIVEPRHRAIVDVERQA